MYAYRAVHDASRDAPQAAFTLVELLVVIAIITLLVALVTPALRRAREEALSSACLSTLRPIGAAIISYAAENRGRLPTQEELTGPPYYTEQLRSYISDARSWACPTMARTAPKKWKAVVEAGKFPLTLAEGWSGGWPSYGATDKHVIFSRRVQPGKAYVYIDRIQAPSSIYLLGEMLDLNVGEYPQYYFGCPIEYNNDRYQYRVHGDYASVLFADASVKKMSHDELKVLPTAQDNPWNHPF